MVVLQYDTHGELGTTCMLYIDARCLTRTRACVTSVQSAVTTLEGAWKRFVFIARCVFSLN